MRTRRQARSMLPAVAVAPCALAIDLGKVLSAAQGGGQAAWLGTHPAPRERAERMRQQVA